MGFSACTGSSEDLPAPIPYAGPVESSLPRGGSSGADDGADIPAASGEIVIATDQSAYREGLSRRRRRLEDELTGADEFEAVTWRRRISLIDDAAADANIESSFLAHRGRVLEAETALTEFLVRFAPDARWEAQYALRTGDLELVASSVRSAAAGLDGNGPAHNSAAEVLVRLGNLAAAGFDFEGAERILRLAVDQANDPAIKARALASYADLLRTEHRNREAREVEIRQSEALRGG